ncbi:MAG TPA: hypothetical protein VFR67_01650, partial [Pilimelia sp.]|nr:hypothetical protein [Pilimelia sp.]
MSQPPPPPPGAPPPPPPGAPPPLPPGAPPRRQIRGRRVAVGIGIALLAHLLTVAAMLVGIALDSSEMEAGTGFFVLFVGQVVVLVACLTVGIVLAARNDGGV